MATLTPRGRCLRWLSTHRGLTEDPPGSNSDHRKEGIRAAQLRIGAWLVGLSWCGVWAVNAALRGLVRIARPWRWASVAFIEDDARAHRNGFRGWITGPPKRGDWRHRVFRGDLLILFGRGVHVETLRELRYSHDGRLLYAITDGGNTSSGNAGSQSNGGGSYRRLRYPADIYGVALVDYPDVARAAELDAPIGEPGPDELVELLAQIEAEEALRR